MSRMVGGLALVLSMALAAAIAAGSAPAPEPGPPAGELELLGARVDSLFEAEAFAAAEPLAREGFARAGAAFGPRSAPAGRWTRYLADALHGQRRFGESRPLFEEAAALTVETSGPDSSEVADALTSLGTARHHDREGAAAFGCFERAIRIYRQVGAFDRPGPRRDSAASALDGLGNILLDRGQLAESRPVLEEALAVIEAERGPDHPTVAHYLHGLGWLHYQMADYPSAHRLYDRELAIYERAYGPKDRRVGDALGNLAIIAQATGDYAEAEEILGRALATDSDSMQVTTYLNTLATVLGYRGDLDGAHDAFARSLAIIERKLGREDFPFIAVSANMGTVQTRQGLYAAAERTLDDALALAERVLGPRHPSAASILVNLAVLRREQGDADGAAECALRALGIQREVRGDRHPELAKSLATLAGIEIGRGKVARADSLYGEALGIVEAALGPEHEQVAVLLTGRAEVEAARGDLAAARALEERALALDERKLGAEHSAAAADLHQLGTLEVRAGLAPAARSHFERALRIREKALGPGHPLTGATRLALAQLDLAGGHAALAWERARAVFRSELELWEDLFAIASDRKALRTAARIGPARDLMLSAALAASGAPAGEATTTAVTAGGTLERTYEALLGSRGQVLDHLAARQRTALAFRNTGVRDRARKLTAMRQRLANLVLAGPGAHPERYGEYLAAAAREKEEAAIALARALEAAGESAGPATRLSLAELRAKVPEGAAVVEYVRFADGAALRDVCFVARAGAPLRMVPIGGAALTDSLVGDYRQAFGDPGRDEAAFEAAARELAARIWAPVEAELAAGLVAEPAAAGSHPGTVLLVLDGSLHLVDFDALVGRDGRYLVEGGWTFHRLTSARDLARYVAGAPRPARGAAPIRLLAVGDPDFAALPAARLARAPALGEGLELVRSVRPDCRGLAALDPAPLPGTRREVEDLRSLGERGIDVTVLTGADALEERIKLEAPRHELVHLATHGYFVNGQCPEPGGERADVWGSGFAAGKAVVEANPLLLSGMLLAGCKSPGPPAGAAAQEARLDDGFLTAEEIAALDLRRVEWAVLSACDTGLGRIEAGEGVLGLGHALEIAGARSSLMSLVRLPDVVAPALMRDLYAARLAGEGTAAALRRAKLAALGRAESELLTRHPSAWAGMVSAGDWR